MTDDEMLAALAAHGVDAPPFPMRAEPEGEHPGDRVFRFPVLLADGRYLGVAWSFGRPSDVPEDDWKIRWLGVDGPMTLDELRKLAARVGAPGLAWHYGPTGDDPDPAKMWCDQDGTEVFVIDDAYVCCAGHYSGA